MNGFKALPVGVAKPKLLRIQTRRILWPRRKHANHVNLLAKQKDLLLENLAELLAEQKELKLTNSNP